MTGMYMDEFAWSAYEQDMYERDMAQEAYEAEQEREYYAYMEEQQRVYYEEHGYYEDEGLPEDSTRYPEEEDWSEDDFPR